MNEPKVLLFFKELAVLMREYEIESISSKNGKKGSLTLNEINQFGYLDIINMDIAGNIDIQKFQYYMDEYCV
ncbi:hypothetical protein [Priestia megaterium]|uniref:hypothetical protein n=1 Tax=Priestia megaterium TaxID=1404 RepID=UPI0005C6192B|nr:hypothetical protein [Priestia megaterium]